jgi:hypothetical protein
MTSDPHLLIPLITASAAAWLMTRAGLAKNMLESRRERRACPSCRRLDCRCAR